MLPKVDKESIGIAATMGIGTVQAFTTFVGSVSTSDMMESTAYQRGVGMSLGWSFLFASGFAAWSNSYAPLLAWVVASGAMFGAYEYHRSREHAD